MATVAAVIASTHHPFYYRASTSPPETRPPFADAWVSKILAFRETLTRARPDVLVMVGSDHFHQLWLDNMPQFLIGKAPFYDANFYNEEREFGLPRMRLVHVELRGLAQAVGFEIPLARDEDVVLVRLLQRPRGRLDDDRAVHPVRDVHQHGLGAAVVHEHARIVGAERVADRLARHHVPEGLVRRHSRGVEVDGVRDRAGVGERDLDQLSLPDVDDRTGCAAGPLAVHLLRHGRIASGEEIEIEQGTELRRPSRLYARATGTATEIERVEVGGSAVVVARGEFRLP